MIPKKALQTMIYCITMGAAVLLTAKLSEGLYFKKVLPLGLAIIFSGITSSLALCRKGRAADQECDEREQLISRNAMKFTFYVMSFVLTCSWSYTVATTGTLATGTIYMLYAFWGSFLLAYVYNKFCY